MRMVSYRIVDLRPGPYTVTFTLPGFAVVRREGIELTSSFTATVNADMRLGGLEETITVTGETPVVDLSSARQQTTVSRDTLDAIPTTKRLGQYAAIIPGAVSQNTSQQDVGGTAGEGGTFAIHGGRVGDQSTNIGGNPVNMLNNDVVSVNSQIVQEVVVETSATSAEAITGGVQVNVIPREGGNQFSGTFSGSWTGPDLAADNLNDDLIRRGLTSGASIKNFHGRRRRNRRPDQARQAVVLRSRPRVEVVEIHSGGVLQQEPGRHARLCRQRSALQRVALRTGPRPAGPHRLGVLQHRRARHVPGDAAEQVA